MALHVFLENEPLGGLEMPPGSEEKVLIEVAVSASAHA